MTTRFIRRGVSKFYFVPTLTGTNGVPVRSDLASAQEITKQIADVAGWMLENTAVPTPDMGSSFDSNIPGTDQAGDSSFTFYEALDDMEVIETAQPKGTTGFVIILRKGDKPTSKSMDTWPVRVKSKSSEFSAGNDPARFMIAYAITSPPTLDQPVPAAS